MIQTEKLNEKLICTYSDAGFKIKRDGVIYDESVDPIELNRKYTETDIPASQSEKTYTEILEEQGALLLMKPQNIIPPTAGLFSKEFPKWQPDKQYKQNELFVYNEVAGYVKQPFLTSQKLYPPFSVGTEALYGARPKPDENGIYPYVYNMGIYTGMLVRGNDGNVYRSKVGTYEMPQDLLFEPKDVPAMLERME